MPIEHVDIPDGERHEPKGADAALPASVYVADGVGAGAWSWPQSLVSVRFPLVATADTKYLALPFAGTIVGISVAVEDVLTTPDTVLSFDIEGTGVTDGDVTLAFSGSAAGDVFTSTPTANNAFAANQAVGITSDGAGGGGGDAYVTLLLQRTA